MKAYTDLEQSKKLAEILPIESADMRYAPFGDTHPWFWDDHLLEKGAIPCWSLAALLDQLEDVIYDEDGHEYQLQIIKEGVQYYLIYGGVDYVAYYDTPLFDDLIDCCYEMVLILKENDLL